MDETELREKIIAAAFLELENKGFADLAAIHSSFNVNIRFYTENFYKSIAATICKNNRYTWEYQQVTKHYHILFNPNFELNENIKSTNKAVRSNSRWMTALTGTLVFISVIGLVREIIKDNRQSELKQLLKSQGKVSDSLRKTLQKLPDSFQVKNPSPTKVKK